MRVASSRKNLKNSKKVKPQDITKGISSKGGNDLKTGLKRTLVTSTENPSKQMQQQSNQQPILITSSGELGNVEFLQQTVDDQTGHVITTTLPMMTTTDGTTVVQVIYIFRYEIFTVNFIRTKGSKNSFVYLSLAVDKYRRD